MGIIKKWTTENKEVQDKCINEVITRVEEIAGDSVGLIAAQDIIDIVLENLGPEIYNSAVLDAKKLVDDRMMDIQTEIDLLQIEK
jgi:uncharacterized protein (DUF2164 family)